MRIFEQVVINKVRLQIRKQGEPTEYLTLCETTIDEVYKAITALLESKPVSPLLNGRVTGIDIREEINSKNGKSKSLSFRGMSPLETKNLIINAINEGRI